jgi:deoxyadenosine/deoxycytidine kinase
MSMTAAPVGLAPTELRAPYRYVALEGPIGVGKSSLAKRLAEHWSMRTLFERPADNPFLHRFYDDMARYALPTQLHFALQRIDEARQAAEWLASGSSLIADFIAQKNSIFARLTLSDDEWHLYRAITARMETTPPPSPELVVYLRASPPTLAARVQKRARPAEDQIPESYLRELSEAYDQFFADYDESPVLTVDTEHLNPLESAADFAHLVERIEAMRGSDTRVAKAQ